MVRAVASIAYPTKFFTGFGLPGAAGRAHHSVLEKGTAPPSKLRVTGNVGDAWPAAPVLLRISNT
ncbi:hypothetical protein [Peristeroidobacter soli]|uniref:hypothetical protein n=1 Tax=Peristeroidobacter soli TaxID=2497877 RepID=UPI0013003656|nr:hypothetical protein [Peristeroidobacter soli]